VSEVRSDAGTRASRVETNGINVISDEERTGHPSRLGGLMSQVLGH